jgi:hypothetical protein
MTSTAQMPQPAPANTYNDFYDSDDAGFSSPRLEPLQPNLKPSPSPPPNFPPLQVSPPDSPGRRKASNRRPKHRASQADGVLISFLDGGKQPEIARFAACQPLASDDEMDDESLRGASSVNSASTQPDMESEKLTALAIGALNAHVAHNAPVSEKRDGGEHKDAFATQEPMGPPSTAAASTLEVNLEGQRAIPLPINISGEERRPSIIAKDEKTREQRQIPSPEQELAPMQERSPEAGKVNGSVTLPSIATQLGDLTQLAEAATVKTEALTAHRPSFSSGSPQRPLPFLPNSAKSPPISPSEVFGRELPSPGPQYASNLRRPSQISDGAIYSASSVDYGSTTETPSTDQSIPTPVFDRMSIDGITHPQNGAFRCQYAGCLAAPFSTQYLLNSHANVHSSNRPHYCNVKDCPRSEGGKGFKRKNEMIRHGLVHQSPGYVCPFCPDRDHKYPRPDNLQRWVEQFADISLPASYHIRSLLP